MKPAPFRYRRPGSLDEALRDLAADRAGGKVLAGGQSLVPLLSMRLAAPTTIVDVNALTELDSLAVGEEGLRVGALARHARVLASPEVRRCQPLLSMALGHVAHATIRNRGTVVGSLVHADPAAEVPMIWRLLGGSVDVAAADGGRTIEADDLFAGPLESTVRAGELATSAWLPALGAGQGVAFAEISRRHGDYALVGVAAVLDLEGDRVGRARAGYLSVADVPTVVDLTGPVADGDLAAAADLALTHLDPADDLHASADYRAHLVRVLTTRVLGEARDHALQRAARVGG